MRMEMMLLHYDIDLWELCDSIYFTRRPFAIDEPGQLAQFIHDVETHGPFDLCIIDTGPAHSQADDENDNREMHKLAMAMRDLMSPIGAPCTIALMHPGKVPTKDQLLPRGGSSFTGSIDGVLCLWRESKDKPSELFAHQQKYRHEDFAPLFFDLKKLEHPTIKDNFGYPVCSVVAELGSKQSEVKIDAEFFAPQIREQLLPFLDAIEQEGDWLGLAKSGTTANNPFKKSWRTHHRYPTVLKNADDDRKQVTYKVIEEMIADGVLVLEARKMKDSQRDRDCKAGIWLTDKGRAEMNRRPDLSGPTETA